VEDAKVQYQHAQREKIEQDPVVEQGRLPIAECRLSIADFRLACRPGSNQKSKIEKLKITFAFPACR
jgi:hypothetical protein